MEIFKKLKLSEINPRYITSQKFAKLKSSIQNFPKMLELRPIVYDENYEILAGNMRFRALQDLVKEGFEIKDTYFVFAEDLTEEEKREFVIKDNVQAGDWDDDLLANSWSDLPLLDWGITTGGWQEEINVQDMWKDMPEFGNSKEGAPYRSVQIHFEIQKDVNDFSELLGQTITEKTKYLWFPRKEKRNLKDMTFETELEDEI